MIRTLTTTVAAVALIAVAGCGENAGGGSATRSGIWAAG